MFRYLNNLTPHPPLLAGEGDFKPFSRKEKGWDEVFGERKFGLSPL